MSTASASRRQAVEQLVRDRNASRGGAGGRRVLAILALVALATLVILWLCGFFAATPAEVLAVRSAVDEQVTQLAAVGRNEAPLSYESTGFGAVMERAREVPREHRDAVRQEMGRLFEARERAELDSYFATPPDRRTAELDRRIKAEEDRRKSWEAERARRQAERTRESATAGAGSSAGATGSGGSGQRGTGGGGGGGGGPPTSGRRDGTEESRNARRKTQLDATTPERRAMQTEYRRQMDERRRQLGLEPGRR
jgi:uncharacterized membrane protein YgcG